MSRSLSFRRFIAVLTKEFVQMRRDRLTFAMIAGIPIIQLVLFGFAINTAPKALPTAPISADTSEFTRSFVRAMENTGYFKVTQFANSEAHAERLLELGEVQFVVAVPHDFSRKLVRGERPALLIEADATDPAATGNAISALATLNQSTLARELSGALAPLADKPPPVRASSASAL